MTDKQIIDVSDCNYHNNGKCTNSAISQCNCANVVSCYYKEYKRKEQECEKAKQNAQDTYDLWQALIESFNILQGEKIKLEQECEELKKELESTKGLVTVGNKKLKEYLKENINLKVRKERYCQILSDIQDEARDGYCSGTQTGCENSLHKILQKINEVEDENM